MKFIYQPKIPSYFITNLTFFDDIRRFTEGSGYNKRQPAPIGWETQDWRRSGGCFGASP